MLKLEFVAHQIVHAIALFRDPRSMLGGVREDMVHLMREHAAQGASERRFALLRRQAEEFDLHKVPQTVTIQLGKWQNLAVTNMRESQRAFHFAPHPQARDIAAALYSYHCQLRGHFIAARPVQIAPFEMESDGLHDTVYFRLKSLEDCRRRLDLELRVQRDDGWRRNFRFTLRCDGANRKAQQDEFQQGPRFL